MTDERDFALWYSAVADDVTKRIIAAVGDPVLGREASAEAFARAYERWERVRAMESPEGWVYRTAQNVCRSQWRRRRIEKRALAKLHDSTEAVVIDPHEDDVLVAETDPSELPGHLDHLPERMKAAVHLRYWEHLSEAEVAERMDISNGTASAMLSQARRRLRSWIDGTRPPDTPQGERP